MLKKADIISYAITVVSQGDYKVKSFSCMDQFLCMAFAQLTYRESLRDIESCLRSIRSKLITWGFADKFHAILYRYPRLYTILQILSVTIFEKTPIFQALTETDAIDENNQNDNQLKLFNL